MYQSPCRTTSLGTTVKRLAGVVILALPRTVDSQLRFVRQLPKRGRTRAVNPQGDRVPLEGVCKPKVAGTLRVP